MKYIIGTLCYQNNKGNNEWNSEKKIIEKKKRHIHINSFCYTHTHTHTVVRKKREEHPERIMIFLSSVKHIHDFCLILYVCFYPAASRKREKGKYTHLLIRRYSVNVYYEEKSSYFFSCHSESGSMYRWVKRNERKKKDWYLVFYT